MGYTHTNLAAAVTGSSNRFVVSVDMKVGLYTLANAGAMPTAGARHVTCTRTVVGGSDTAGTVVIVGKDLANQAITETLTPGAHNILVTGTKWFASVTSVTGVGWVTNTGNDTIVVGCDDQNVVCSSSGFLRSIIVNTTAAGACVIADAGGTIATLPSNAVVGHYYYDLDFYGYLRIEPTAAMNLTIVHSGTLPTSYAMS